MKECTVGTTLQRAIEKCKENGGRFRCYPDGAWWWIEKNAFWNESLGRAEFITTPESFDSIWIYKPPKQSAFQKWIEDTNYDPPRVNIALIDLRKEGWNAAINAVVKIFTAPEIDYNDIEHLKEK